MTLPLNIALLAAGQGKRMRSALPKVLHPLAGRPLVAHVLAAARALSPHAIVVVTGYGAEAVESALDASDITFVRQDPPRGTGDAVRIALRVLPDEGVTLVGLADVPLVRADDLAALVASAQQDRLALLTASVPDPTGLGRILRDADEMVRGIVEESDATPAQRALREINTGFLAAPTHRLRAWTDALTPHNAQQEFYLTDIVAMAVAEGVSVEARMAADERDVRGINDRAQLAALERVVQLRHAEALMAAGTTIVDPARIDIRGTLICGRDVLIDIGCVFEGEVKLADGVRVGPYCIIRNAAIGRDAQIEAFTHIDDASIGGGCRIGPYARLRPATTLAEDVHIGNFVEVKASTLSRGAKANHLAYIGDASVGARVNYGAGAIIANYDGANKHRTVIGDDVHVGSNCVLIAPIVIGAGATIGGGSTIARDAPAGKLTLARPAQVTVDNWQRPRKIAKPNDGKE